MNDPYQERFSGISRLYGDLGAHALRGAHVAVIGIGGVGSWCAEALARTGLGEITLVDLDDICISNTNRQIHTLSQTVGQSKVKVMAERLRMINPECHLNAESYFLTDKTLESVLERPLSGVIDAIDAVRPKCLLLAECVKREIPIISCGAAGGRRDATLIRIADLSQTFNDALLHQVRKNLRSNHGFPSGEGSRKKFGVRAIFSPEDTQYPQGDGCVSKERPTTQAAGLRCDAGLGAVTHVTATFGLLAAGEMINSLGSPPHEKGGQKPPS
ncbi:MAG: hypothetical protein CMP26_13495 [Roseibacillus sp.]|nr:hypothetical protein [Roseibacillus sp.]HAO94878.1 hypothetical protein [Verrucomicrobiales bacterium]